MYKNSDQRLHEHCLACGKPLYGRTDKKFCGNECRCRYHNRLSFNKKNGIVNSLYRNYNILEKVIESKRDSADICDLESMGYKSAFVTGFHIMRNHSAECRCFDISFRQSGTKLTRIRKTEPLSVLFSGLGLLGTDD